MQKIDKHVYISLAANTALAKLKEETDISESKIMERLLLGKDVGHLQFTKKR